MCIAVGGRAYALDSTVDGETLNIPAGFNETIRLLHKNVTVNFNGGVHITNGLFLLTNSATCTLNITGTNSIKGGYSTVGPSVNRTPGIYFDPETKMLITGTGTLNLSNDYTDYGIEYPAIGNSGRWGESTWEVTINMTGNGTVNINTFGGSRYEMWHSATSGIGLKGKSASNGTLIIHSGKVTIDKFGGGRGGNTANGDCAEGGDGGNGGELKVYGGIVTINYLRGGDGGDGSPYYYCGGGSYDNARNGGKGGNAPSVYIYGGTVTLGAITKGIGGQWGWGIPYGNSHDGQRGAAGSLGELVIAGGSVKITGDITGVNNCARKTPGGAYVYGNTLTFNSSGLPVNYNDVNNRSVTCGKIGNTECVLTSKKGSETADGYGLNGVKTDGSGKVYIWLPPSAAEEVRLGLSNCTPHSATYERPGGAVHPVKTLNWGGIKVTYKCVGVGCNTSLPPQVHNVNAQCGN